MRNVAFQAHILDISGKWVYENDSRDVLTVCARFLFVKWLKCDLKMQYTDSTPLSQLLQIDANFTCLLSEASAMANSMFPGNKIP